MSFSFRNHIARYRYRHNFSQSDLAKLLGVSKNTVSSWETGVFFPTLPNIFALMEIFLCSFDDLFYRQFILEDL